jgi:hypothetical protein
VAGHVLVDGPVSPESGLRGNEWQTTGKAMTVSIPHPHEVDTEAQPTNLMALLRELGVKHVSVEKQEPRYGSGSRPIPTT